MSASLLRQHTALPSSVRSALWLGDQLTHAHTDTCSSGFPPLDAELPGGGWPLAGLTELLVAEPGSGELALLAPALAQRSLQQGEVVWVAPPHLPYAPALHQLDLRLDRFTWLAPATVKDAAWAVEQVLRSGACAWVQWWCNSPTPDMLRRLHLAALDHPCALLLLRPFSARYQASPAPLRLICTPLPRRHLAIHILKRRGPALGRPIALALPDPVLQRRHLRSETPSFLPARTGADAVAGDSPTQVAA